MEEDDLLEQLNVALDKLLLEFRTLRAENAKLRQSIEWYVNKDKKQKESRS